MYQPTRWFGSLRFAAVALFAVLAIALMSVISLVANTMGSDHFRRRELRQLSLQGEVAVITLGQTISGVEELTRAIAQLGSTLPLEEDLYYKTVPAIMGDADPGSIVAGGGIWPEPGAFVAGLERRSFFWGREADGILKFYDDYNDPAGPPYHGEEWYVPARFLEPGQAYWSRSYMDPYSLEPMATCTVPYHRAGEFAGVATVDVKLSGLEAFFRREAAASGGYIFAVDRGNRFLTYPDPKAAQDISIGPDGEKIVTYKTAQDFAALAPSFATIADTLASLNRKYLGRAGADRAAAVTRTADAILSASHNIEADEAMLIAVNLMRTREHTWEMNCSFRAPSDHLIGEPVTIMTFPVPNAHWKVVLVWPESRVQVAVASITRRLILLLGLPLTVLLLAGYGMMDSRFTRPVRKLTSRLKLQFLDPEGQLQPLPMGRRDELGELVYWFNQRTAALREAQEESERATRIKSVFLANMSHEIRTPMNGIMGAAHLLEGKDEPKEQEHVQVIRDSASSLLTILNDILDYSKLEAGEFRIDGEPFNLADTVRSCQKLLSDQADKKGIKLAARCDLEDVDWYEGDSGRIRQILLNLLSNAIKYTDRGEVGLHTYRRIGGKGEPEVVIDVTDTGIGIAKDEQEAIFEMFRQSDAGAGQRRGGTGLGLSISRRLCELMGGGLTVESEPGEGSRFQATLPLKSRSAPTEVERTERATQTDLAFGLDVLLVEDNPTNRLVARRFLERLGCEVAEANDGLHGVQMAAHRPYSLILMDVQMPKLDGIAATRQIRTGNGPNRNTPIVALTASALDDDRQRCASVGMSGFLTKPLKPQDLLAELSRWSDSCEDRAA